jgi:hypothetical protein
MTLSEVMRFHTGIVMERDRVALRPLDAPLLNFLLDEPFSFACAEVPPIIDTGVFIWDGPLLNNIFRTTTVRKRRHSRVRVNSISSYLRNRSLGSWSKVGERKERILLEEE